MHKLLFSLTLALGAISPLFGQSPQLQTPLGAFLDLNGQLIHGHADLDLAPADVLLISFNSQITPLPKYTDTYYRPDGSSVKGEILYTYGSGMISLKKDEKSKKEKIKHEVGGAVKRGVDSLVVADAFFHWVKQGWEKKNIPLPRMLLHVADTEAFSFFKTTHRGINNYVVYVKQTKMFVDLPVSFFKEFKEVAAALFTDYPDLLELLQKKELPHDDMPQLIRFIQYTDAFRSQKPLTYTADLKLTNAPSQIAYTAQVQRYEDQWRLDFSTPSGEKLFTEHYLYAKPQLKHGDFVWYYPASGIKRREYSVNLGEPSKSQYYYHPNGELQYGTLLSDKNKTLYLQVQSPDGQSLVDGKGTGTEQVYDQVIGRTLVREFQERKLTASYYIDEQGRKVYQLADHNASVKQLKLINKTLSSLSYYPKEDAKKGIEGLVLVRVLLDTSGKPEHTEVVRGITPAMNQAALTLFKDSFINMRFSAGRHQKEDVVQEVLVPVYFQRFYQPTTYYHHYNPFFNNPAFMPVTPPSIPRF
ncbi:energy transducer TonB [Cesiribacter andamanensis]|uniref:Gram-negative bacterial tonB protein n=1 Tax=Cesiribacter andamanensis AMV16 TaxID=1279009 RepID=M7N0P7_9BACT|nr:energy transducer TonB [Cesiribacter andamanensis]EMR00882.1 Gram-negative bacterial tonB protein [Cesiribacter andamanensis AMV16]